MTLDDFQRTLREANPPGTIIKNPGGGTSKITEFTDDRVSYVRGASTISVKVTDLFAAYDAFRGKRVSSTELRQLAPSVFDSSARPAGHSCNCTFLFGVLERANLSEDFRGEGVRGSPYSVVIRDA